MALGRLELTKLQKGKIGAHVVQALFTFIAVCVLIAMLARKGKVDGRVNWYLALCFLSIPAWIYLIMTPMWERTVKFANAFVMASVDVIYTIFWLSAIIALGVWVNEGKNKGSKEEKVDGGGNCSTFAYGSEKKCKLAVASVGLGVPILLLWIASSSLSIIFILQWKKGEGLPWKNAKAKTYQEANSIESQTKDAWSSDMQDGEGRDSDDERLHNMQTYGREEDEHDLLNSTETGEGRHPGIPWRSSTPTSAPPNYVPSEQDYQQSVEQDYQRTSRYGEYAAPSALSPVDYERQGAHDSPRTGVPIYPSPVYR